ncbi:unnamed protein product [Sphagnum troendelagicum]|uniref:Uncharacterized protein n=1 Tax=Sphagnum troendelagicum TaxID=128251 RepID=A0ABP0UKK7_9BRYO
MLVLPSSFFKCPLQALLFSCASNPQLHKSLYMAFSDLGCNCGNKDDNKCSVQSLNVCSNGSKSQQDLGIPF